RGLVLDSGDRGQRRLHRRDALGLDAGLVHERGVIATDLRHIATRAGFRRLFDDGAGVLQCLLGQQREAVVAGTVGRYLGVLRPGAVGVAVEIVAGRDGAVHAGDVETEIAERGFRLGWRGG